MYLKFGESRSQIFSSLTHRGNCEEMDVLISLIMVIISQCIHISKHYFVHLGYIQLLFVNYSSIKQKNKGNNETLIWREGSAHMKTVLCCLTGRRPVGWEEGSVVRGLLCSHEGLCSGSKSHGRQTGMVPCACYPKVSTRFLRSLLMCQTPHLILHRPPRHCNRCRVPDGLQQGCREVQSCSEGCGNW